MDDDERKRPQQTRAHCVECFHWMVILIFQMVRLRRMIKRTYAKSFGDLTVLDEIRVTKNDDLSLSAAVQRCFKKEKKKSFAAELMLLI